MVAPTTFSFMPEGRETGALIQAIDWQHHPIGAPEHWPASLKSSLAIMLGALYPMCLWWGPELYQFYNDAFIPMLGAHKHPEAMGQRGVDCWAEAWSMVGTQIHDAAQGRPSWNEDRCVPLSRNGTIADAFFTYSYSPVTDEAGNIVGVLNIVTETTQRIHAERVLQNTMDALAQARQELHRFLMQVPVGIAILSGPQHVYTLVNPVFRQMTLGNRPISDFLGKSVREALPELAGQGFCEILDSVYRTGQTFVGAKLRASIKQANGLEREMFINFTYQARRDEKGRIEGIVVVLYEVTDAVNEQKEIEMLADSLRAAVTARDVFLGVASHELNTPLTTLMLQSEMFLRHIDRSPTGALPPAKIKKFGTDVFLQSKRLERLVHDMLDVSRLAAGNLTIMARDNDLSALMNDTLDRFLPQFQSAGCTLVRKIPPHIHVNLDVIRIEQVLSNLLVNAIKYAPKSQVCVTLSREDKCVKMCVIDSGPGIAPESRERIFGRFERATHPNEVSGLGLGLYISERIMLAHGGEIYVLSEVGSGSTFVCELPV